MLAKLFQKSILSPRHHDAERRSVTSADLDPRVVLHYGIPSTASILAVDPIQGLLAVGTLDGRIKVIGGDNIECLLISPKQLPFKNLEFLHNQGFLVSVSNENEVQVWDLECRHLASNLQWESNITAFSVIYGTQYMYVGDEHGSLFVLKYGHQEGKLLHQPYHIPANAVAEVAGISVPIHHSIVGVLPQPCSHGNRMLIAYENGLLIVWDAFQDSVVCVRGYKDLQVKNKTVVNSPNDMRHELSNDTSENISMEKDISSLCWASANGSILAVGYIDGDIILWNLSTDIFTKDQPGNLPDNAVKLQLSSGSRRLPVIMLYWSEDRSHDDCGGHLFIYGGEAIGSDEVLTILSLDWSSGIENLKCVGRLDLTLNGSFADMILLPKSGVPGSSGSTSLFVLTNPGQLHVYDDACLSALMSEHENRLHVPAVQYPVVMPTVEPYMTVGKLSLVHGDGKLARAFSETASALKLRVGQTLAMGNRKWPLTGGLPCKLSFAADNGLERMYIAGYQDGSVRIWDATYPALSLVFAFKSEVKGIEVAGVGASVSALDFCSLNLSLAIGNECGLIHLYQLLGSSDDTNLHFVTETEHEVRNLHQENEPQCTALFSLLNSPVRHLQFSISGARLLVGFECGQVTVLDTNSLSVLFHTSCIAGSSSPLISLAVKTFSDSPYLINSPKDSELKSSNDTGNGIILFLTKDAHIVVIDGTTGSMISSQLTHPEESTAISMYIFEGSTSISKVSGEKNTLNSPRNSEAKSEPAKPLEVEPHSPIRARYSEQSLMGLLVLLCCEDALYLYSLKSVIQGDNVSIQKVNLVKPCRWTTTFKKDEKESGLVLLYQSGDIEIRSLPELEVVGEYSLMSIIRWNFKANMDKAINSSDRGQIILVNGCEIAFISLLASENDFRIPECLPCLHNKVLAEDADAAVGFSPNQKKKQDTTSGILGGIIKGFSGGKVEHNVDLTEAQKTDLSHLDSIFSRVLFSDPSTFTTDSQGVVELSIDDIEIDGPLVVESSSRKSAGDKRDKETERENLFEGSNTDVKPKTRTPAEIIAKYRSAGDASTAAAHARDRLVERQEKLERISQRSEELRSGAENFASMASELAKKMENRKWWNK